MKKWTTGRPLTIQLPSRLLNEGTYPSNEQNGLCDRFDHEEMSKQPSFLGGCLGHTSHFMNLIKSQHGLNCFLLYLYNLAEPTLLPSPCNKIRPYPLVCIKDKVDVKFTQVNRKSLVANYLCTLNAI